ncbi:MAG: Cardiolipin synthetase, partial [uncultured Nocardioides sp.]
DRCPGADRRTAHAAVAARPAGRVRDRALGRRLLPPTREEATALPGDAPPDRRGGRRRAHDVHLRAGPLRRHARRDRRGAEAGPLRDLHLEGRRGRRALQGGAHRGGGPRRRGPLHLRRLRQPGRRAGLQAVPAVAQGAALPGVDRGPQVLEAASLRPRPPQAAGRRRRGRLPRRLQHRLPLRHGVARHPRADHRTRRVGPQACLRRLLEPQPATGPAAQRPTAAAGDRLDVGAGDPHPPQRPPAVALPDPVDVPRGDPPGEPQHLDHPGLLPARPGLRGLAGGRGAAGRRRTDPAAAEVQPHRGRLDLARLLRPAALGRGVRAALPRRDGARQDRDDRRQLVDRGHRQHRPAQPPGQLRDQPRDHRLGLRRGDGADLPHRPGQLPRADAQRVGGARPQPQVHRELPGTAPAAAL